MLRLAPLALVLLVPLGGCGRASSPTPGSPTSGAEPASDAAGSMTYANDRFGFSVDVPERFEALPPPQNGDGRRFRSPDGRAELAAFGAHDALGEGLAGARRRAEDGLDEITRQADVPGGFVLEGRTGGTIRTTKVVLRDGRLLTLEATYPEADRAAYADDVARALQSFPGTEARADAPPDEAAWTTAPTDRPGSGDPATLVAVRSAAHDDAAGGYDRVVFEFEGARPGVHVGYADLPVRQCGSGRPVRLDGERALEVRLTPARAHDDGGTPMAAPGRRPVRLDAVREIVSTCDFEGEVAWVLGLPAATSYRVSELSDPSRLVVDVRHL